MKNQVYFQAFFYADGSDITPVQNILEARKKYLFYANKDRFYTIFKINPLRFPAEAH